MDVVAYQSFASPASHYAMLKNIKDFAAAQGWTIDEFRDADCLWSSGWGAGTESFLQMHTHGYGSNYAGFRIRAYKYYVIDNYGNWYQGANCRQWRVRMHKADQESYSNIATHPVDQPTTGNINYNGEGGSTNDDGGHYYNGLHFRESTDTYLRQVIFGNANFIDTFIQLDATFCCRMLIGVPVMFDTSLANCSLRETCYNLGTGGALEDYASTGTRVISQFYFNDAQQYGSLSSLFGGSVGRDYVGPSYVTALLPNTFALARPILRDVLFVTSGGVRYAVGYQPWGKIAASGLQPFQELSYGAETYMVAPLFGGVTAQEYYAYRIA